jgi:muconolactone delta-isomerase
MAQFIALIARNYDGFTEDDFAPLLEAEAERARELYAAGTFRQMWGRLDVKGAVALIEADSPEAAQAELDTLPLNQKGMLEITLVPLNGYRGFGPRG